MQKEIQSARREWTKAVAGLKADVYTSNPVTSSWTLKDIVGHLATYLQLNVAHLRAYKKRRKLASMRAQNWYRFNRRESSRLKNAPLKKLQADFESAYAELLAELATLKDDDLKATFPSPWSRNDTRRTRLSSVLRADVSRHLAEHARDVEKWRASEHR